MTSQSPACDTTPTAAYADAWASMGHLVVNEGLSWSGRERNRMFLSLKGERFVDSSAATGTDFLEDARALGLLDWDGDGQVDMLLRNRNAPRLRLLHNRYAERSWLQLRLSGDGKKVNRDAIGARATLKVDGRTLTRSLTAGDGHLSQSSKTLFFGLGDAESIESLTVRWPDGRTVTFEEVPIDRLLSLDYGDGNLQELKLPEPTQLIVSEQKRLDSADLGRVTVVSKVPMAEFPLPSLEDPERKVKDLRGRPLLINFWSTTCASCLEELEMFRKKRKRWAAAGLQVVPMLADGEESLDQAKQILEAVGLLEVAGVADKDVREGMKILAEAVLTKEVDMPLPVSLLLDAEGNLVQLHLGAVRMPILLQDLKILKRIDPKSPSASALAYGRLISFRDRDFATIGKRFEEAGMVELGAYFRQFVDRFRPGSR